MKKTNSCYYGKTIRRTLPKKHAVILLWLVVAAMPAFADTLSNGWYTSVTSDLPVSVFSADFLELRFQPTLGIGVLKGQEGISLIGPSPYMTLGCEGMYNVYGFYGEYGLQLSSALFAMQDVDYSFFHHTVASTKLGLGYMLNFADIVGIGAGANLYAEGYFGYKADEKYWDHSLYDLSHNFDGHAFLVPSLSFFYNINPLLTLSLGADFSLFLIASDTNNFAEYIFYPLDTEFYAKLMVEKINEFRVSFVYNPMVIKIKTSWFHNADELTIGVFLGIDIKNHLAYADRFTLSGKIQIPIRKGLQLALNAGCGVSQYQEKNPTVECTLGAALLASLDGGYETSGIAKPNEHGVSIPAYNASAEDYLSTDFFQFEDILYDDIEVNSYNNFISSVNALGINSLQRGLWTLLSFGCLCAYNFGADIELSTEQMYDIIRHTIATGGDSGNMGVCFNIAGFLSEIGNSLPLDDFEVYAAKVHISYPRHSNSSRHFCNTIVTDEGVYFVNYNSLFSTGTMNLAQAFQMYENSMGLPGIMIHTLYYMQDGLRGIVTVATPDRVLIDQALTIFKGRKPLELSEAFMDNMRNILNGK